MEVFQQNSGIIDQLVAGEIVMDFDPKTGAWVAVPIEKKEVAKTHTVVFIERIIERPEPVAAPVDIAPKPSAAIELSEGAASLIAGIMHFFGGLFGIAGQLMRDAARRSPPQHPNILPRTYSAPATKNITINNHIDLSNSNY